MAGRVDKWSTNRITAPGTVVNYKVSSRTGRREQSIDRSVKPGSIVAVVGQPHYP